MPRIRYFSYDYNIWLTKDDNAESDKDDEVDNDDDEGWRTRGCRPNWRQYL